MNAGPARGRGFTLVELMISVGVFAILITSILSTFILFAKSSMSVGHYAEMSGQSRSALEVFSRDVRAASALAVANPQAEDGVVYSETGITFSYPAYHGARTVTYQITDGDLLRTEVYNGATKQRAVLTDIGQLRMKFFQTPGSNFSAVSGPVGSVNAWTKSIQLDAKLVRTLLSSDNTDYIISARFMMRN